MSFDDLNGELHNAPFHDQKLGYEAYYRTCRSTFRRGQVPPGFTMRTAWIEVAPVLSAAKCAEIRDWVQAMTGRFGANTYLKDGEDLRWLLSEVFTPEVDRRIVSAYGSEYLPHFVRVQADGPETPQEDYTFTWHVDSGPTCQLKMLLYLDPTEEHGSTTAYLPPEVAMDYFKCGYAHCPTEKRLEDLSDLAAHFGLPYDPVFPDVQAGSAVMLHSPFVFHRFVAPTRGTRHIVHIGLLPSPFPWRQALDRLPYPQGDISYPEIVLG